MRDSEILLLSHLTETESLNVLASEGFANDDRLDILTKEGTRKIVKWALNKYFQSGRVLPVTKTMLTETWGDELEALGVEIDDETELEPIEWVIEDLAAAHSLLVGNGFAEGLVTSLHHADGPDRPRVLAEQSHKLFAEARKVQSKRQQATADEGLAMSLDRYHARTQVAEEITGMAFGMPSIDNYTMGIHPGELCVFAGASGSGKSWIGLKTAFEEWRRSRRAVLFTLENSLDMTFDRLACVGSGADYELYQRGKLPEVVVKRIDQVREAIYYSEKKPLVVMPPKSERSMEFMVRKSFADEVDSLIIDQLSFVDPGKVRSKDARWAVFSQMVHDLYELISSDKQKLPCLLLHQIKGDGVERAKKTGFYTMEDLAESREIDRTADFVFAVYQDLMMERDDEAEWQTLKGRRVPKKKHFPMIWNLGLGHIAVINDPPATTMPDLLEVV